MDVTLETRVRLVPSDLKGTDSGERWLVIASQSMVFDDLGMELNDKSSFSDHPTCKGLVPKDSRLDQRFALE